MSICSKQPFNKLSLGLLYPQVLTSANKASAHTTHIPETLLVKFPNIDTKMGIEIELEDVNIGNSNLGMYLGDGIYDPEYPITHVFKMIEDGSLRNNGWEFVSKVGLSGQEILWGVNELLGESSPLKGLPSTSYRTSIHVHINVLDITVEQYKKLVLWYCLLEPLFFNVSGNRSRNIFCVPAVGSDLEITKLLRSDDSDSFVRAIKNWTKYSAFNLLPTCNIGTVEFRHHAGTADYNRIEQWLLFLWQFFTEATNSKTTLSQDLQAIVKAHADLTLPDLILDKFGFYITNGADYDQHVNTTLLTLVNRQELLFDEYDDADEEVKGKIKKIKKKQHIGTGQGAFIGPNSWIINNSLSQILNTATPLDAAQWDITDNDSATLSNDF